MDKTRKRSVNLYLHDDIVDDVHRLMKRLRRRGTSLAAELKPAIEALLVEGGVRKGTPLETGEAPSGWPEGLPVTREFFEAKEEAPHLVNMRRRSAELVKEGLQLNRSADASELRVVAESEERLSDRQVREAFGQQNSSQEVDIDRTSDAITAIATARAAISKGKRK